MNTRILKALGAGDWRSPLERDAPWETLHRAPQPDGPPLCHEVAVFRFHWSVLDTLTSFSPIHILFCAHFFPARLWTDRSGCGAQYLDFGVSELRGHRKLRGGDVMMSLNILFHHTHLITTARCMVLYSTGECDLVSLIYSLVYLVFAFQEKTLVQVSLDQENAEHRSVTQGSSQLQGKWTECDRRLLGTFESSKCKTVLTRKLCQLNNSNSRMWVWNANNQNATHSLIRS